MADENCFRGSEPVFIVLRVEREPLDQTDLKDNVNAILGGDGGTFWKVIARGHSRGPGSLRWG
jgi:hypothetical protein